MRPTLHPYVAEQEERLRQEAQGELRQQLGAAAEAAAATLEGVAAEHAAYRAEAEAELAMLREERDELSRQAEAMAVELREMAELRRRWTGDLGRFRGDIAARDGRAQAEMDGRSREI